MEGEDHDEDVDDDPPLPDALAEAFATHPDAHARWRRLARGDRWFQIGPIHEAKKPETRARRAQAIVDWLLHEVDDTSVPAELETVLAADPEVRRLFDALSTRDRTYWSQHVREAKQAATRVRRAEKVAARLPVKAAEREERKARGTDDLGGRFGQLVIDAVGADLRAAGYRPRAKGKHWRRADAERADLIGFHTFTRVSPEFAELRLEGGIYLPVLDHVTGGAVADPRAAPTEAGLGFPHGLAPEDRHFAITADVDEAALADRIRRAVLAAMAAIDALGDLTDPEVLLAACRTHWHHAIAAALVAAGHRDEGRHAVLAEATRHAAEGHDPRTYRSLVHLAEQCGLPVEALPEPVLVGERPYAATRPVVEQLFGALGATVTWCVGRQDGTVDLTLLQPTDAQVAEAHVIAGDVPLHLTIVDVSLDEQTAIVRRLQAALVERERRRDDLVAHVCSWGIGSVMVEVANLDPETESLIRELVPDPFLTIIGDRPAAVLLVQKSKRLRAGSPALPDLAELLEISRLAGGDGRPADRPGTP